MGPIPFGVVLAVFISMIALLWEIKRMYLYAVLILAAFVLSRLVEGEIPDTMIIPGAIILMVGLFIFFRFLRQYSLPQKETNND